MLAIDMLIEFCIPIKNEAEVIEKNLSSLLSYLQGSEGFDWKIVVSINDSDDKSEEIMKKMKNMFPDKIDYLNCLSKGKGAAIKSAWRRSSADVLAFMDADLAVDLRSIPELISPILKEEAELVVSSRFLPGSSVNRSIKRGLISKGYVFLSKLVLGHKLHDIQCGFKLIKKRSFRKIEKYLQDDQWFFDTELVVLSGLAKLRIEEVAVIWNENRNGTKKSNIRVFRDSYNFIKNLLLFKIRLRKIKRYFDNV